KRTDEPGHGRIVAVWGPAGAPGRTTLALGLADQFAAAAHERVALIDADPYGGAIAGVLGVMDEVSGLRAAIRAANNGHHGAAGQSMYRVGDMDVLTGLPHAHMWMHARAAGFSKVLREARHGWSTTVIDTGFGIEDDSGPEAIAPKRNHLTLMALETADHIVVCGSGDPVGLSRLVRGLHELHDVLPACEPIVVVNRFRGTLGWARREIADTVERLAGLRPDVFIPYDLHTLDKAVIEGRTVREVDPGCALAAAYAATAGLCGRGAQLAGQIVTSQILARQIRARRIRACQVRCYSQRKTILGAALQRMSTVDAMFLANENAREPRQVASLAIVEDPDQTLTYERLINTLEKRIDLVPRYRQVALR